MKQKLSLQLLILVFLLISCGTSQEIPLEQQEKLVSLKKGGCFGRCPIYELTVYTNGKITYRGERYTQMLGLWESQLDNERMQNLRNQLKKTNLWQYPEYYASRLTDMSLITITQYEEDVQKSVAGKEQRPGPVQALESLLESYVSSQSWTVREPFDFGLPDDEIPGQLIVTLEPGVYPESWILKYLKQDMRVLGTLPDRSNQWLVTYNPTVTFPMEMERFLLFDEDVKSFEHAEKEDPEKKRKKDRRRGSNE